MWREKALKAVDGPFELADVVEDMFGDEEGDFVGNADALHLGFMLDDRHAGF